MTPPSRTAAPFGTWPSPITADLVAESGIRLSQPMVDGERIYWLERRPLEGGRYALARSDGPGRTVDVTPREANVRSRVHEYGGAAALVSGNVVFYVEYTDQRVYRLDPDEAPVAVTPEGAWRYADFAMHPSGTWMVAVGEDHGAGGHEPITTLVAIAAEGPAKAPVVLASGFDFYGCPRFSPDGRSLCWIAWRHPQMPWDGTELWTAPVLDGPRLGEPRRVAGGDRESIFQPGWLPDGSLVFVSDRSGWWNLHREAAGRVTPVCPMEAEFGRPMWQFGMSTWAPAGQDRLVAAWCRDARWRLSIVDVATGALRDLAPDLEPGQSVVANDTHVVTVAGSVAEPDALVRIGLTSGDVDVLRPSSSVAVDPRYLSKPRAITFPTDEDVAHALFYPPANVDVTPPAGDRPPLIVVSHGGPTDAATAAFDLEYQYWTSRGFAIVDVNYRGSTGYGRGYRDRLRGQWGVADVADCVNAARYLAAAGEVDPDRLAIRGGSAGGYTTLAALTFRPEVFKAGASYYGVSDLEALARDTHKFEARYLDSLVGPYPADRAVYVARSPINAVDRLACPLILFQGLEDAVVPPNQARMMADAVRAKGLPVALLLFEGEQHGFRRPETIRRCLESELAFYGIVFGFQPTDELPPLAIDNRPPHE